MSLAPSDRYVRPYAGRSPEFAAAVAKAEKRAQPPKSPWVGRTSDGHLVYQDGRLVVPRRGMLTHSDGKLVEPASWFNEDEFDALPLIDT